MTIEDIINQVAAVKPLDKRTIYRHIKTLKIQPLGMRQRPQNYPPNAPALILSALGYETALLPTRTPRLASMKELKAIKRKAAR